MKTYVIDIDGTICSLTSGEYEKAAPKLSRIEKINKLYDSGNYIIYYTARGMGRTNNDEKKANNLFYQLTKNQLTGWGAKFHKLRLGKPSGDLYIDDKGIKDEDFFAD